MANFYQIKNPYSGKKGQRNILFKNSNDIKTKPSPEKKISFELQQRYENRVIR